MKKLLILIGLILPCVAMSQSNHNSSAAYKASYSSNFEMSDAKYSNLILQLWKDYEENSLDRGQDLFTDTVKMFFSDGSSLNGRQNIMTAVKSERGTIKDYKCSITAYMSTKSVDKDKHWVSIWGDESYTDKDGKPQKNHVHEIWGFNKDGKVDYMASYTAKTKE